MQGSQNSAKYDIHATRKYTMSLKNITLENLLNKKLLKVIIIFLY